MFSDESNKLEAYIYNTYVIYVYNTYVRIK